MKLIANRSQTVLGFYRFHVFYHLVISFFALPRQQVLHELVHSALLVLDLGLHLDFAHVSPVIFDLLEVVAQELNLLRGQSVQLLYHAPHVVLFQPLRDDPFVDLEVALARVRLLLPNLDVDVFDYLRHLLDAVLLADRYVVLRVFAEQCSAYPVNLCVVHALDFDAHQLLNLLAQVSEGERLQLGVRLRHPLVARRLEGRRLTIIGTVMILQYVQEIVALFIVLDHAFVILVHRYFLTNLVTDDWKIANANHEAAFSLLLDDASWSDESILLHFAALIIQRVAISSIGCLDYTRHKLWGRTSLAKFLLGVLQLRLQPGTQLRTHRFFFIFQQFVAKMVFGVPAMLELDVPLNLVLNLEHAAVIFDA